MQSPIQIIEVNIKNNTGTDFYYRNKHLINDVPVEEKPLQICEVKGSALIVRYLNEPDQPFALFGIYEQWWRKENHVFQLDNPDLYIDDAQRLAEIKASNYYKKLIKTPIAKTWNNGYWGLKD